MAADGYTLRVVPEKYDGQSTVKGTYDPTCFCPDPCEIQVDDDTTFADVFERMIVSFTQMDIFTTEEQITQFKQGIINPDKEAQILKFIKGDETYDHDSGEPINNVCEEDDNELVVFRQKPNDTLNAWMRGENGHKSTVKEKPSSKEWTEMGQEARLAFTKFLNSDNVKKKVEVENEKSKQFLAGETIDCKIDPSDKNSKNLTIDQYIEALDKFIKDKKPQ